MQRAEQSANTPEIVLCVLQCKLCICDFLLRGGRIDCSLCRSNVHLGLVDSGDNVVIARLPELTKWLCLRDRVVGLRCLMFFAQKRRMERLSNHLHAVCRKTNVSQVDLSTGCFVFFLESNLKLVATRRQAVAKLAAGVIGVFRAFDCQRTKV